jgi:hypothetical protein
VAGKEKAVTLAANDRQNVRRGAQVRMFSLMQLKALLQRPPARRPDAAVLAALNGDCAADRATLKSDELADFCLILAARRTGSAPPPLPARGDRLTERWGLDLAAERQQTIVQGERAG